MEENINKKNNIQVNALNVGTEKASSKYYSYQNDYTDIIQANTNNFNGNEEISLSSLFQNTPYEIIDSCLYKVTNKKGNKVYQKLSNFVPYLKNETIIDDGVDSKRYLVMEGRHSNGKKLPSIRISANDFNNMNWITKNWGLHCNIETGQTVKDCIRHAIQCTANNIITEHIYCHTGWTKINNKLVFLSNGLYLANDIEANVELDGKLSRYRLTDVTERNIDEDLNCIKKLLDTEFIPHKIILPLIALAFLSPLNHFLKIADCEPKLVLFLVGKTGAKKSTLASLILSFFGDFTNTDLPISFRDTANSIIAQAFILKDVLTVIDDYHPSTKSDEQSMNKTAQVIMRSYGDRIGKNRLNCDSTLKISKPPRGNVIITGESTPDISQSGTARYISIELNPNDINITKLTELQELSRNGVFKSVMSFYIRLIYQYLNGVYTEKQYADRLRKAFMQNREILNSELTSKKIPFHPRIPEALSWLFIGFEKFLNLMSNEKILTDDELQSLVSEFVDISINSAISQAKKVTEDNPSIKFITKLNSLLEGKLARVQNLKTYQYAGGDGFIGYEDDTYYYLIPSISHKLVKKLCDEQGELFSVSEKTLLKHLDEDGFIEISKSSRTKLLRIGDKVQRFIWIKKEKFNSII